MDSWSHYPERTVLNESKYVTRVDLIDLDFLWDKWLLHIWFLELIIRLQIEISRVRLIYVAANESGNVTRVKSCLELTDLIDLCIKDEFKLGIAVAPRLPISQPLKS